MQRRLASLLTLALLLAAVSPGVSPALADGFVSVSTTVSPTDPVPETPFTITATVSSAAGSDTTYTIDAVEVRRGPADDAELVSERDTSTKVRPGTSREVPIETTLNRTGTHTVYLHLKLVEGDLDRRRVVQPVTVEVYQPHPQVDVSTDPSAPGDDQTMTVSVSNGLDGAIRNVELVVASPRVDVRNPRRVVATVAGGGNAAFDFRATPASEAIHDVNVTVRYTHGDDRRSVTRTLPTDFSVAEGTTDHPQVTMDAEPAAAGEPRRLTLSLSNGLELPVRNVEVVVAGAAIGVNDPRRVVPLVEAGTIRDFRFTVTPTEAAALPVNATIRYTVDDVRRSVTHTLTVDFTGADEPAEHPQVGLSVGDAVPGATRPVNLTVANGLDRDVRQVTVVVDSPVANFSVTERVKARLAAGETTTFRFPARVGSAGTYPVTVTLSYTDEDIRQRLSRTFEARFGAPPNPGEVTLTGVEAVQRGGTLEISATASNVGSTPVEGVVVSIGDAPAVGAADYFVGSVEGSDFASFTLTAGVAGNVSSVPLEVRYVVDGVERSTTTTIPVERVALERPTQGSSGPPLLPIAGVVVLVVVVVLAYRRRG